MILFAGWYYLDDCIWFSKELMIELEAHCERLKEKYKKQFRGEPPTTAKVDLGGVDEGIIPPDADFERWTKDFKKPQGEK
jgi:hypothetical protein